MLTIDTKAIHSGYDRKTCWVHARAGMIPGSIDGAGNPYSMVLTMHALRLTGDDVFYPIHDMRTDDGGQTWDGPNDHGEAFARRSLPGGVEEGVSDFWPTWHAQTGVLLGTGHTVRYIDDNLEPHPRPKDTTYSVYDPVQRCWSAFQKLETPDQELFFMEGAGSTQRVDLDDGQILLPTYTSLRETTHGIHQSQDVSLVMRCAFDGHTLTYLEHGDALTLPTGRGFSEPSLIFFGGRYLITLRNDDHNYLATSDNGLHFGTPDRLKFDDGSELGSYNTQTHWLVMGEEIYLVYTRRGANNGHVLRHRAPLFIGRFDADRLCLVRDSEQILVPERGARLGNFGITPISENESWVTVTEWMQTTGPNYFDGTRCEKHGSDNSVFVARVRTH